MNLGNPIGVLIFTFVVLLLFQTLAFLKPKLKFWKYCDYIWLLMLLLGVFASTAEINRRYLKNKRYIYYSASRSINRIITKLEDQNILIDGSRNKLYYPEYRIKDEIIDEFEKWVQESVINVNEIKDSFGIGSKIGEERIQKLKEELNITFEKRKFSSSKLNQRLTFINEVIDDAIPKFREYEEWQKKQERQPLEDLAYFFGPFLLVISIGIRLGKTTANIKRE